MQSKIKAKKIVPVLSTMFATVSDGTLRNVYQLGCRLHIDSGIDSIKLTTGHPEDFVSHDLRAKKTPVSRWTSFAFLLPKRAEHPKDAEGNTDLNWWPGAAFVRRALFANIHMLAENLSVASAISSACKNHAPEERTAFVLPHIRFDVEPLR